MTGPELRAARASLGLSAQRFADLVGAGDGSTVRKWERGARSVPGPVAVLVSALLESRAVRRHFGVALEADLKGEI